MMTLKGIFPETKPVKHKNFIRENVKNIRRISLQSHKDKSDKSKNKNCDGEKQKVDKRNISANVLFSKSNAMGQKVMSQENCHIKQMNRDNKGMRVVSKSNLDLMKTSSDSNIRQNKIRNLSSSSKDKVTYVSRGIQTSFKIDYPQQNTESNPSNSKNNDDDDEHSDHLEEIEENVEKLVINSKEDKCESNTDKLILQKLEDNATEVKCDNSHSPIRTNNIECLNEENQFKLAKSLPSKSKSSGLIHRLGVVPKYLLERKEALLKEKLEKEAELAQPQCPDGHILLPDQERVETLNMLKKSYQDCINELNRLPIRSDTLRAHQKKIELEKKLNKLEDGIKVFSRPKVFVKVSS